MILNTQSVLNQTSIVVFYAENDGGVHFDQKFVPGPKRYIIDAVWLILWPLYRSVWPKSQKMDPTIVFSAKNYYTGPI